MRPSAGTIHRSLASHHPRAACITSPTATSLAVAVFVVDADEGASEGQYLTEGDKNRMVYLGQRWKNKARGKHYAPEGAQCKRREELNVFSHCIIAPTVQF